MLKGCLGNVDLLFENLGAYLFSIFAAVDLQKVVGALSGENNHIFSSFVKLNSEDFTGFFSDFREHDFIFLVFGVGVAAPVD